VNSFWIKFLLASIALIGTIEISSVRAQDNFTGNPLENNITDPLLPDGDRPLSETEIKNIEATVIQLQQEGENFYQQGEIDRAFQVWYRELRLKQKLSQLTEVEALTRVGNIAWQENRKEDLKNIEKRLTNIELESQSELEQNIDLLNVLGVAYSQIRSIDRAIAIYQKIITDSRDKQEIDTEKNALEITSKLYLAKFDYPNAIKTDEKLLDIARSQNDPVSEEIYLTRSIDSYSQISQPEKSLSIKEKLLDRYRQSQQNELIPKLQIAIADDYRLLDRLKESDRNYREAFNLAWTLQQYAIAAEALKKLGDLYNVSDEKESALRIYEELLKVEGKVSDYYGSIDTYDRIGKIYLELKNYTSALAAFDRGLQLAKILKYREDYFAERIREIEPYLNNN
jgi:tetratricopeptide (TPR) repeat protein